MNLKELLKNIPIENIYGIKDVKIENITNDSRNIEENTLFIAIKGVDIDGHTFIHSAVKNKVKAVIYQDAKYKLDTKDTTFIEVKDSRKAYAIISSNYYGNTHKKMKIIGITGTNGKTTTSEITYQLLNKLGIRTGLISTVSAKFPDSNIDTGYHVTTPDALELHKIIRDMYRKGCKYVIIETTSHALDQHRTWGIEFEISAVTNITPEHLDYHRTLKKYLETKARIFKQSKKVILNKYDPSLKELLLHIPKDMRYVIADYKKLKFPKEFKNRFPGKYNLENGSIAYNLVYILTGRDTLLYLSTLKNVEGRMEYIKTKRNFNVIVDFAHDATALEKVLTVVRESTKNKSIVVFGCAGLRDTQKRSKMGEIATKIADIVVITAEDPRTENIEDINKEIEKGILKAGGIRNHTYHIINDRQEAIDFAINKLAKDGDTVLITGKGHEKSMCFGTTEYPWSDQEAVKRSIKC